MKTSVRCICGFLSFFLFIFLYILEYLEQLPRFSFCLSYMYVLTSIVDPNWFHCETSYGSGSRVFMTKNFNILQLDKKSKFLKNRKLQFFYPYASMKENPSAL
jgi:hypothetical protein